MCTKRTWILPGISSFSDTTLTDNGYKSFWYPISCCQTRSGSSFLRVVWVLGSWSLWVLGNLLCLTPHMASSPPFLFSYRPLLPLLSLISFSILHSIDVISSSNRPLLFYSLIYSSLFLSLWFWRFYVFYHFYLKWFTSSFFVFTFSFLLSHFNLECLFCHIVSLSFLLLSDCRSSSVNSASVKVLYK